MAPSKSSSVKAPSRPVPMLDLQRQYAGIREEILAAVAAVCDSGKYILGPEVREFEKASAAYLGVVHSIGCASGTDALYLALAAAGVGPGDEVITSPFTFFASASSITRVNAKPVFVDIEPDTLNLSAEKVSQYLAEARPHVKAIMPIHLYGQCADMDAFCRIGEQFKLRIVEDAAQAFGASWRGRRAGSLGDAAGFSFYPTKNLSAMGDAGLVTTNSDAMAESARSLRNHGSKVRYFHDEIGWNSRIDSIQAAVLNVKMKHIDEWNAKRREKACKYFALFREAGVLLKPEQPLERGVHMPATRDQAFHIYHQFVVRAAKRDELRAFLSERGIGTEIYYPLPLHQQRCLRYLGYGEGSLPESERAAREVLALPIFPEITEEEQRTVVEGIAEFYS